ncbi:Integrator complex subunit 15 [Saguinus oedipus]|uniref:Integrator complex subunit 15 n=1 Tax=Saguinus oedipus TaxID=9490 RepID=A0ABQ9WCJ6_SAGOE|nr:Integrator complex subunit 15 [Saguinus oedipus]
MYRDSHLLYSKLHLSVLQVLMTLQLHLTEKNLYGRLGLILFDHMVPLVEEINSLKQSVGESNTEEEEEKGIVNLRPISSSRVKTENKYTQGLPLDGSGTT